MFLFPFLIEPFQKYHLKTNICHLSYRWSLIFFWVFHEHTIGASILISKNYSWMASIWNRERDGRWFGGVSWHLGYRVTRIPRYRSSSSLHTTIYTIPSNSPKKLVREDLLPSFAVPRHKRPTCPSFVSIWRSVASFAWRIGCPSCETRPGVAFSLSLSDLAFGVQAHLSFAFGSGLQVAKEGRGGGLPLRRGQLISRSPFQPWSMHPAPFLPVAQFQSS